ncbi:hypothetical protein KFE25_005353 [Diacronema lutheri]|uniref:NADP-dependent oxidoreductase domain-containing protein n=1 Tax=Diacronema lutheri TaxID=2081491 RepID=A0A8J5XEZ4_DIALT|nr:hypothetical protein KFE25_005353 [Diacronema lutheri]
MAQPCLWRALGLCALALGALGAPSRAMTRRSATVAVTSAFAAAAAAPCALRRAAAAPVADEARTWRLDGDVPMPTLALNTAGLSKRDTERAVLLAASLGITHVDFHPGIERDGVSRALKGAARPLFLTTKLRKPPPGAAAADAAAAVRAQLAEDLVALGLDRVDLLLMRDHPSCDVMRAQWRALEEARAAGRARSIGVVNFCEGALRCVLETARVRPAVNYFMLHAGMGADAHGLRTFGEAHGVRTFAYGPLGEPRADGALLGGAVLRQAAEAHGRAPEEVALRWLLQSGCAVSVRPTADFSLGASACGSDAQCRPPLLVRARSYDWALSAAEMDDLDALREPDGNPTLFSSEGCPGPSPLRS